MFSIGETWFFYGGDLCYMGEIRVESREVCIFGCIICSRICGFVEQEEEAVKSLTLSSFILSLITKH
jgi:hypothetical protein